MSDLIDREEAKQLLVSEPCWRYTGSDGKNYIHTDSALDILDAMPSATCAMCKHQVELASHYYCGNKASIADDAWVAAEDGCNDWEAR